MDDAAVLRRVHAEGGASGRIPGPGRATTRHDRTQPGQGGAAGRHAAAGAAADAGVVLRAAAQVHRDLDRPGAAADAQVEGGGAAGQRERPAAESRRRLHAGHQRLEGERALGNGGVAVVAVEQPAPAGPVLGRHRHRQDRLQAAEAVAQAQAPEPHFGLEVFAPVPGAGAGAAGADGQHGRLDVLADQVGVRPGGSAFAEGRGGDRRGRRRPAPRPARAHDGRQRYVLAESGRSFPVPGEFALLVAGAHHKPDRLARIVEAARRAGRVAVDLQEGRHERTDALAVATAAAAADPAAEEAGHGGVQAHAADLGPGQLDARHAVAKVGRAGRADAAVAQRGEGAAGEGHVGGARQQAGVEAAGAGARLVQGRHTQRERRAGHVAARRRGGAELEAVGRRRKHRVALDLRAVRRGMQGREPDRTGIRIAQADRPHAVRVEADRHQLRRRRRARRQAAAGQRRRRGIGQFACRIQVQVVASAGRTHVRAAERDVHRRIPERGDAGLAVVRGLERLQGRRLHLAGPVVGRDDLEGRVVGDSHGAGRRLAGEVGTRDRHRGRQRQDGRAGLDAGDAGIGHAAAAEADQAPTGTEIDRRGIGDVRRAAGGVSAGGDGDRLEGAAVGLAVVRDEVMVHALRRRAVADRAGRAVDWVTAVVGDAVALVRGGAAPAGDRARDPAMPLEPRRFHQGRAVDQGVGRFQHQAARIDAAGQPAAGAQAERGGGRDLAVDLHR